MHTIDYTVRLFIACAQLLTFLACFARALLSNEIRARVGNVAFGSLAGVGCYSQIPLLDNRITSTTWLLAVASLLCLVYLAVLVRKGL